MMKYSPGETVPAEALRSETVATMKIPKQTNLLQPIRQRTEAKLTDERFRRGRGSGFRIWQRQTNKKKDPSFQIGGKQERHRPRTYMQPTSGDLREYWVWKRILKAGLKEASVKLGVAMLSVHHRTVVWAFCPSAFSASVTLCVYLVHTVRQ